MSDSSRIWFPFYVGDYIADTMHLTTEEHGAYLLILCHQWRRGHLDEEELGRVTRLSPDAWSIAQGRLKQLLSIDQAGKFFSARLDREKGVWSEKSEKAQEKARKAANARWKYARERKAKEYPSGNNSDAPSITPADAQALHDDCPSPSPGSTNTPPSASLQGERAADPGHAAPVEAKGEDMANKGEKTPGGATGAPKAVQATRGSSAASAARGEPKPGTLHDHLKRHGNGRRPPAQDVRFLTFKDHLCRYHAAANGKEVGEVPWGVREDRALVTLLSTEPHLGVEELSIRLGHRLDAIRVCSEHPLAKGNVNARDSIAVVLNDKFPLFTDGPVNSFGDKLNL